MIFVVRDGASSSFHCFNLVGWVTGRTLGLSNTTFYVTRGFVLGNSTQLGVTPQEKAG